MAVTREGAAVASYLAGPGYEARAAATVALYEREQDKKPRKMIMISSQARKPHSGSLVLTTEPIGVAGHQ